MFPFGMTLIVMILVNEAATFVRDIVFQNVTTYSKAAASFTTF
jgi:hypothetical protein